LLAPGFQTSVIVLATLCGHLQFKNGASTKTGNVLRIGKKR